MATLDLKVHRRYIVPPQAGLTWSIGLTEATVNEGATITGPAISVALNGYSPAADEFAYITLTTMTAADFAVAFPGETQATSASGDFPIGYTDAMKDAIEALGGTGVITQVNGINAIILGFKLDTFTSVSISRATTERPGDNGSRRLVHQILDPSNGTIATASDSCVINDISIAPGSGDLTSIEITNAFVDVFGPGQSPATGTEIGRFVFKDDVGDTLTPGAGALVFPTGGDSDGRFAIFDFGSGSDRYRLRHTAVVADFEGAGLKLNYPISVQGTIGAVTITQPLLLHKRYALIDPTGNQTATEVTFDTCDAFKTLVNLNTSNRTIKPSVTALATKVLRKSTYTGDIINTASNITWDLGGGMVFNHRKGMFIRSGNNIRIVGGGFGVGTSDATVDAKKDIDNAECGTGSAAPDWLENVIIEGATCFASNDELWRVKNRVRGFRFNRVLFCYPFYPANHTKSGVHNHGPAVSDFCGNVVADKCLLWAADTRMFQLNGAWGFRQTNCVIGFWKDNQAGVRLIGSRGTLAEATATEAVVDANLLVPAVDNATYRGGAIELLKIQEAISNIYVPQTGNYVNFFCFPGTDDFGDHPLTVANGAIVLSGCSGAAALTSAANFENVGLTIMPTATEQNRRDVFDDVVDNAGDPDLQITLDVRAQARAGIADTFVSPAAFEALYGSGSPPWMGGGSLTHGVVS